MLPSATSSGGEHLDSRSCLGNETRQMSGGCHIKKRCGSCACSPPYDHYPGRALKGFGRFRNVWASPIFGVLLPNDSTLSYLSYVRVQGVVFTVQRFDTSTAEIIVKNFIALQFSLAEMNGCLKWVEFCVIMLPVTNTLGGWHHFGGSLRHLYILLLGIQILRLLVAGSTDSKDLAGEKKGYLLDDGVVCAVRICAEPIRIA